MSSRSQRIKLLIVDDEPEILESFKYFFEEVETDYQCFLAQNGEEGIKLLESERPAAILLDLKLGKGLNGIDFLKYSKENFPDTKVIVFTGYLDRALETEARSLGADAYLRKSLDPAEVIESTVRNVVSK
ncbi:MAG: response regulator [Candidatus Omnitrophica bacterium]|nr:response regulator [Candidatus Omnitrophota bacterium]